MIAFFGTRLRVSQVAIMLMCWVLVVLGWGTAQSFPRACASTAGPCPVPEMFGSLTLAGILAASLAVWMSPWVGAGGTVAFSAFVAFDTGHPVWLVFGLAAPALAWWGLRQPPVIAAGSLRTDPTPEMVPYPHAVPHPRGGLWSTSLLGSALILAVIGWWSGEIIIAYLGVGLLIPPGIAVFARRWAQVRAWRQLTAGPLPVAEVWYLPGPRMLYYRDADRGDSPIATVRMSRRFGGDNSWWPPELGATPRRAVLYGGGGQTLCAVAIEEERAVLTGVLMPASGPGWPYDQVREPKAVARSGHRARRGKETIGSPEEAMEHRFETLRSFAGAAVVPGAVAIPLLAPLTPGPPIRAAIIATVTAAVTVAVWWWTVVRPVIRWNHGGLTVVDHVGRTHICRWPEVNRVEPKLGYLRIVSAYGDRASISAGNDLKEDRYGIYATRELVQWLAEAAAGFQPGIEPPKPTPHPGAKIAMPVAFMIVAVFAYIIIQR